MNDAFSYSLNTLLDDSNPLRRKASSRSSPIHSFRSSFSAELDGDILWANEEDHVRPPWRRDRKFAIDKPGIERNCSYIYSLCQDAGPSSVESTSDFFQRHITGSPLSASPDEINASSIFEPFPAQPATLNIAEMLLSSRNANSLETLPLEDQAFLDHRDTFEIHGMHLGQHHAKVHLPLMFFQRLLLFIDFQTYLSLRLSCRCWSASVSYARPVRLRTISQLPAEILQQVYTYLSPLDFNSARHTCRAWMVTSLDRRLLENNLRCGGWWGAAQVDKVLNQDNWNGSEEWLLSKRLATECCFLPDWAGNGLNHGSCWDSNFNGPAAPWKIVLEFDQSFLHPAYHPAYHQDNDSELRFDVSSCGRFVLAIKGRTIYICSFCNNNYQKNCIDPLEIITSVTCPSRVQSVSMDTSHQPFHVAALLEGRVGLVCELKNMAARMKMTRGRSPLTGLYPLWANLTGQIPHLVSTSPSGLKPMSFPNRGSTSGIEPSPQSFTKSPASVPVPVEDGPFRLYPRVCLDDDIPLSVAISSQQQHNVVAFGSASGTSLHWINFSTGQPVSRWIPLTTRSEVLKFFPIRQDAVDDGRVKMKLVSSLTYPFKDKAEDATMLWESDEWRARHTATLKFYQVVPLSDGRHFLYLDPWSGKLCLGTQVQVPSNVGGTKMQLTTKFVFEGPIRTDVRGRRFMPAAGIYAVAEELKWGVRVVAGFRNQVWVFCIPIDWFLGGGVLAKGETAAAVRRIPGVPIGDMESEVTGLGIRTTLGGGLLVWGLGDGGMGKKWEFGSAGGDQMEGLLVSETEGNNGVDFDMWEMEEEGGHGNGDGDFVMRDWTDDGIEMKRLRLRYGSGGSEVLREGEGGEDVVMRWGDANEGQDGDGDEMWIEVWEA